MVKHMKDLEAQTSMDLQLDNPKSSDSESQPGNCSVSKEHLPTFWHQLEPFKNTARASKRSRRVHTVKSQAGACLG